MGSEGETRPLMTDEVARERGLLKAVVETAVDVIVTIDESGIINSANPAIQKAFGYAPDELIGQSVSVLMPEPYRSQHGRYIQNYLSSGVAKIIGIGRETQAVRKDGTVFPIELAVSETITPEGRFFTGILRDISERRAAEDALRNDRALLKAVVETAIDGIVTIDEQGTVLSANDAVSRIFGYAPFEIVGQNVRILMPAPYHDEHDRYLANYHETGIKKIIGIGREVEGRRKDGTVFPLEVSVGETVTENGKVFTGFLRDISERKRAERAIRELNSALEERVRDRTKELEALVQELEGFCHSIAHDMRTPLRSINGFAQIVIDDYQEKLDEEGRELLERIADGAVRIGKLMDGLLSYARIGRRTVEAIPVDLSEIARNVSESHVDCAEIEIQNDMRDHGDPELLRVLLDNLIGNACKYVPKNTTAKVEVGCRNKVYFVRDEGIGFDMRWADKIFEPFQRLHSDSEYVGTGIGLATVRRIVVKHGGRIWAESAVGKGATFFFTLDARP